MPTRRDVPELVTRMAVMVLLWAPALLWLTAWRPPEEGLGVHFAAATALAVIGAAALRSLFTLPEAADAPGRHRVLPSRPHRPMLVSAAGFALIAWGAWRGMAENPDIVALSAISSGGVALWLSMRWRADPLWGTWIELVDDTLRVHCPRAQDWTIPLSHARAVHLRTRDGSFLLETPWPERDILVPSRRARARYYITGHRDLLGHLTGRVPIRETPVLAAVLRRRRAAAQDSP